MKDICSCFVDIGCFRFIVIIIPVVVIIYVVVSVIFIVADFLLLTFLGPSCLIVSGRQVFRSTFIASLPPVHVQLGFLLN